MAVAVGSECGLCGIDPSLALFSLDLGEPLADPVSHRDGIVDAQVPARRAALRSLLTGSFGERIQYLRRVDVRAWLPL
jgi:hypothetical protein